MCKMMLVAMLLGAGAQFALGSDAKGNFTIFGFEDDSCGAWVRSSGNAPEAKSNRQTYLWWFRGFVSGYSMGIPKVDIQSMPDSSTLALYVDKFCRETPLLPFVSAAPKLVKEISKPLGNRNLLGEDQ
ncbi:MAG: hypothetical protein HYX72_05030 [Acidobacteria bacterium]|nr:hypothetical protein [Acidobacteriota bacterium]